MYLPSEVILMRDISAGVPMNEPIPPAVTPAHTEKQTYYIYNIYMACIIAMS